MKENILLHEKYFVDSTKETEYLTNCEIRETYLVFMKKNQYTEQTNQTYSATAKKL